MKPFLYGIMKPFQFYRSDLYNDFLTFNLQGFSIVSIVFFLINVAIVCPISLKSVDKVVIPPASISLRGVSL